MQRIVYKTITRFGEGDVRDMIEGNIEVWGEGGENEKTPKSVEWKKNDLSLGKAILYTYRACYLCI